MLVADPVAHAVHIYNTTTETYVGNMIAPDPGFTPVSVAVGPRGEIYVAESPRQHGTNSGILEPLRWVDVTGDRNGLLEPSDRARHRYAPESAFCGYASIG